MDMESSAIIMESSAIIMESSAMAGSVAGG